MACVPPSISCGPVNTRTNCPGRLMGESCTVSAWVRVRAMVRGQVAGLGNTWAAKLGPAKPDVVAVAVELTNSRSSRLAHSPAWALERNPISHCPFVTAMLGTCTCTQLREAGRVPVISDAPKPLA